MTRRSRKCPICDETGIPIFYGYPDQRIWPAAEKGFHPDWWLHCLRRPTDVVVREGAVRLGRA